MCVRVCMSDLMWTRGQSAILSSDTTNHLKDNLIALATPVTIIYAKHLPIRQHHGLSKLLPLGGWWGDARRWCRACYMSECSNLDPMRRGSLIPDYGSLGLRHADAQVCTHFQSPNLSIWLSALNHKPRQRSLLISKLWQQCRRLKWDITLKLACWHEWFRAHLLSGVRCFFAVWCYNTSVQGDSGVSMPWIVHTLKAVG